MGRREKTTLTKLLSLLVAVVFCLTVFTVPVSAKGSDVNPKQKDEKTKLDFLEDVDPKEPEPSGPVVPVFEYGRWNKVHSNPGTFEKNFILSPEKKEYSIKKYESVVQAILEPEMSDLEKYYTLAIWLNHHVNYDWLFWPGPYDFDYYSHQWDAYGVLKERKSICAGIAVAYANICHAADLPCKFIRMKPYYMDHTINYIPDINGHAYYIDVTENLFFMSKSANPWYPMDPEFSDIREKQLPDDGTFEYDGGSNTFMVSKIKEFYGVPFDTWFNEYGLHQNTKKKFGADYVEDGSGVSSEDPRYRHRSYTDFEHYPAQPYESRTAAGDDGAVTGVWLLDDFYKEPAKAMEMIRNKKFDDQFLDISGVKGSYDCETPEDLAAAVGGDLSIRYFPTFKNDTVVAEATGLKKGEDYTVSCDTFDEETGKATITITGNGDYSESGTCQIPVRFNSAAIIEAPVNNMDLVYTGEPQTLVKPGTAENGKILYAYYNKKNENESWKNGDPDAKPSEPENLVYSEEIPTATDAGRYAVWYKVEGDETHFGIEPQRLDRVAIINPVKPTILAADDIIIGAGEKIKLAPTLNIKKSAVYKYSNLDEGIVKVSADGILSGIAVGTARIVINGTLTEEDPNCADPEEIVITVKVTKGLNPMKVKAKAAKISLSKLKKKTQKIKSTKLFAVNQAQGKLTYKLVSAKNGKKSFKNYFKVDSKTGNVTVKKGLKKGTYKVKVKVKAAGNANYKPSSWKSVTSKVRVK